MIGAVKRAQGRVAVRFTLPLGIERTVLVHSGTSGSAIGATGTPKGRVEV